MIKPIPNIILLWTVLAGKGDPTLKKGGKKKIIIRFYLNVKYAILFFVVDGDPLKQNMEGIAKIQKPPNVFNHVMEGGCSFHLGANAHHLFNKLMALYMDTAAESDSDNLSGGQGQADKVVAYIQQHYKDSSLVGLNKLCKEFFIDERKLTRIFKKQIGMTIKEYILKQRMDLAFSLLIQDVETAKAVAELVGYKDPYYFNTVFKKYFGQSPGLFRKLRKKGKL